MAQVVGRRLWLDATETYRLLLLITGAMLCSAAPAAPAATGQTGESALLQLRSHHAYNALFGMPAVATRPSSDQEWQVSLEHSNQFMGGSAGEEQLLLDGETSDLSIRYGRRLTPCWQAELTLPFIQHSAGEFDRAIDDWHQFFGLPDADRNAFPFDELSYTYSVADGEAESVSSPQSGIGDIRVSVQRFLGCTGQGRSSESQAIARIGIKLPTGSRAELRGSGASDIFTDIQSPVWRLGGRWHGAGTLGLMYSGEAESIVMQRSLAAYGALGVQWRLFARYRVLAQIDWHTPFYDSDLRELGDTAVVLSAGVRYLAGNEHTLELSFSEDAAIDTAPDIVARIAWTYRPGL